MTPTQQLQRAIEDTGGGWFQAWSTPEGWALMVYRNNELHAYTSGPGVEECVRLALVAIGADHVDP